MNTIRLGRPSRAGTLPAYSTENVTPNSLFGK